MLSVKQIFICAVILTGIPLFSQNIYLKSKKPEIISQFDKLLAELWLDENISPANEASDCVMVRRLYIDLAGRVPTPAEALSYIGDKNKDKQSELVKKLLNTEEHAMFMTMRYGDELRIKSEFPINLWPNAAFLYTRTIFEALKNNMPYDKFAACMILSDGSNFRNGYANFFRAVPQKNAENAADAAAKFLLGKPLNELSYWQRKKFLNTFEGIRFKSTREWKEEIVYFTGNDTRQTLLNDIVKEKDFSLNAVKRTWRWIFGSDNVHPEITDFLADRFRSNKYDIRDLLYTICTSAAYRSGSICDGDYQKNAQMGAVYPMRRLDAEVLADSIAQITDMPVTYSSVIPEPFSYYKGRAAALPDGSITDKFLLIFGRPSRDSGAADERKSIITAEQRLYLFNSSALNNQLNNILRKKIKKEKDKLTALYLLFYSRKPTAAEKKTFREMGKKVKSWKLLNRMPWVLLNSSEFLFQH